ncbi:MAG: cysteine desulfurase [Alphaproteobacteria bacterium]|nr:cysteine desulfurase [Alphaproteobacteria bacterium]
MAYLDYNATSPLRPEAKGIMERALTLGGNASSVHGRGRAARAMIEAAREQVAAFAGAKPSQVVFTSGGTEANALALWSAVQGAAVAGSRITRLFVSAIEHETVLAAAAAAAERMAGIRLEIVPCAPDGVIVLDSVRKALREGKGRALIALMAANNETGAIQSVAEASSIAAEAGALLFVDAVQAAGKMPVPAADYVTLSAHKIGGLQGTGALVVRDAPFAAQMVGGGQEHGRRAGTENLAGIAAFGAAAEAAGTDASSGLRDRFEEGVRRVMPDAIIFAEASPRLGNTSNFALPGIPAETALMALDLDGVMMSSGAACSSGSVKPSHVLAAMGVREDLARCALRASFGWDSTGADVDAALAAISNLVARVRPRAAA